MIKLLLNLFCLPSMKFKKFLFWIFVVLSIAYYLFKAFNEFYFLRQPTREVPHDDSLFVSPANWTIIKVIHQDDLTDWDTELYKENNVVIDDWTNGFSGATLVSIMMTPMDAHFQKAPLESKLIDQQHHKWHFFNATKVGWTMKSTFQNEYNNMLYETPEWYNFRIIQIAGAMARRIVSLLEPDDIVEQWQFIWAIKLWSQVSVIFDSNFDVKAKEWDYVIDWETVLATKKDPTHIDDEFDEWNIIWDKELANLDVDNAIRYSLFERTHPSGIATLIWILIIIVELLSWMKIFEKAWISKWKIFVPFYNIYLLFKLGWKWWWFWNVIITPLIFWILLICINKFDKPWILVNIHPVLFIICMYIPWVILQFHVAKKFWKGKWFALWLWLCPTIFYPYLAFIDKNEYQK